MIALEADLGIAHEQVDELAVRPAAVLLAQTIGHLEVAERDDRLNAVLEHAVEHVVIELQAGFVGLELVALGEDAAPANGGAEALEAHLGKERDVVAIRVVEVDALVVGIILARHDAVGNDARNTIRTARHDVGDREAPSVQVVSALQLMRRYRAAPQKSLR